MRPILALLAALLSITGCGAGAPPAAAAAARHSPSAAPEPLYIGEGTTVRVVDGATAQVLRKMPGGAPSPDWRRLFSVASSNGNVQLMVVDTATGAIVQAVTVPAWASEARLSYDGRWLALVPTPDARATVTRFQVRDADLAAAPVDVQLPGAFAFDGLSGDGKRLFLLQLRSNGSYQVKLYDLGAGRLLPDPIVDKTDASSVMSGASVSSFTTADGQEQLTLYERNARDQAFVHVLPIGMATPFAYCVDLPAPGTGWTLAAGPDGRRFFAANMSSGRVVSLKTDGLGPPQVTSGPQVAVAVRFGLVRDAEAKEERQRAAAAVSADGATLFAASGSSILSFDTAGLRSGPVARVAGEEIMSLATGRSGWLYATTSSGRLLRVDPGAMRAVWISDPVFNGAAVLHTDG